MRGDAGLIAHQLEAQHIDPDRDPPVIHDVLETRSRKSAGGGAEGFKTSRDEILAIYRFIQNGTG